MKQRHGSFWADTQINPSTICNDFSVLIKSALKTGPSDSSKVNQRTVLFRPSHTDRLQKVEVGRTAADCASASIINLLHKHVLTSYRVFCAPETTYS